MEKQELEKLSVCHEVLLKEAIESRNVHKIAEAALAVLAGKKGFHDFAVRWVNMLLKRIGTQQGDEGVHEAHREFARTFVPEVVRKWEERYQRGEVTPADFPLEDFIRQRAEMWDLTHDNRFVLEEDEEKFTLTLTPCESGGRLQVERGAELGRCREAHSWTYGRAGFSYYCLHCPTMWEFGWYEKYGYPLIVLFPPQKPGDPCVQHFYKRPELIPASYWQRVGLKPAFKR